jgi:hypothetical protein
MTPKELAELNAFREKEGLPPLVRKQRNCLKCNTVFITLDNRLCNRCNIHNKSYQNADESKFAINYVSKR